MLRKYGSLTVQQQPGSELIYGADGLIRGQIRYEFDAAQIAAAAALQGTAHPEDPRVTLIEGRVTWERAEKGIITFECLGLSRDPTIRVVQVLPQVTTTSIQAHPDFVDVIGGTAESPLNGASFDADGVFTGFTSGPKMGLESFYDGSPIVRATYYTRTAPRFSKAFTITESLPNIAEVQGVTNWLYMPPAYEEVPGTTFFKVTEEFLGSGKRGWDEDVYGD